MEVSARAQDVEHHGCKASLHGVSYLFLAIFSFPSFSFSYLFTCFLFLFLLLFFFIVFLMMARNLGKKLGYTTMEDWYKVRQHDFIDNRGYQLIHIYGNTASIVMAIYNSHNWMPWKFKASPQKLLSNMSVLRQFFSYLTDELKITSIILSLPAFMICFMFFSFLSFPFLSFPSSCPMKMVFIYIFLTWKTWTSGTTSLMRYAYLGRRRTVRGIT